MKRDVPTVISLQGCMAVGKTTALRYLQKRAPRVNVCFEDNADIIAKVKERGLNKRVYADYLEIQKLWLGNEVKRYNSAIKRPCSVMDFGAEEIEFYTLNYPKSIGCDWEIESALESELAAVRKCMPSRILFLNASNEVLLKRKESDGTRSREFFDHYLNNLLPLKRKWFIGRENVDVLNVDAMRAEEVGAAVAEWADFWLNN